MNVQRSQTTKAQARKGRCFTLSQDSHTYKVFTITLYLFPREESFSGMVLVMTMCVDIDKNIDAPRIRHEL